ncbi:heavy metal translocating P-type ATPase [Desulfoscipio geothermicus]|uniref:Cd(2+)-exporting ATPase n=1 Tax=Desulfoscipio geothermicus DSM 3669 TaxID=1121426 RepID=A0A1I6EI29_9FIRM|nr:heavy metal translocating P-type ATPase [Desulfoscipio geothermicus]SFR17399.1 Cd2+/Zn2+-exporting ATPase [Desulfoscipio geothermicus DSM 3669]
MTECNGQHCSCNRLPSEGEQLHILRLEGLDCADCAARLEKKLAKIAGVERVEVNFGASRLVARHTVGVDEIIRAVEEAGYGAELAEAGQAREEKLLWHDRKLMLTVLSGLFLLAGFSAALLNAPDRVVVGFFLATMLSGGFFVARSALYSVKSLSLDMNVLMSVAAIGAAAIGEWAEGATVVFLFALGNMLQAYSMDKTRRSIRALMELAPREALVRRGGREIKLPVEVIVVGDIVIVKPGEKIAVDGKVVEGVSMVNQAPITGESMPVAKKPGDEVFAGTINEEGALEIAVTRQARDTTLARIVNMVEEAQAQRAPSQQFVDVFAKYYTPAVIAMAVAVTVIPTLALGLPFKPWLERALILLVIACPCALVISTPVSIVSAIGSAARRGVLIKGGAYLEEAGALKVVALDKTGTLTEGRPEVTDVIAVGGHVEMDVLGIAAAVEKRSQHPLALAIIRYAGRTGVTVPDSVEFQSITGKGAGAIINGRPYYIGNPGLFAGLGLDIATVRNIVTGLQNEGKTAMLVGSGDEIMGIIAVADRVRENGGVTVQGLRAAGIQRIVMLTGDNTGTARAIAAELGLDGFKAELLPEDKQRAIKELQGRYGKVAMVGDGINDAPALATANIGIAMGGVGTDTALETADITLMADDLTKLPYAMDLSRRALKIIKQNITFALLVKALFIAGTFWGVTNLWMAVFADTGAALLVIANGLRLMRVDGKAQLKGKKGSGVGEILYDNA